MVFFRDYFSLAFIYYVIDNYDSYVYVEHTFLFDHKLIHVHVAAA